jgi:hypothetical protein
MRRGTRTVAIPNPHVGEIRIGLLREILKQAGISDDEWNGAYSRCIPTLGRPRMTDM